MRLPLHVLTISGLLALLLLLLAGAGGCARSRVVTISTMPRDAVLPNGPSIHARCGVS